MNKINFTINETDELRSRSIEELECPETCIKALRQNNINTLGGVIDNWNNLRDLKNLGDKKVKHVRAALHSYLVSTGAVTNHELIICD